MASLDSYSRSDIISILNTLIDTKSAAYEKGSEIIRCKFKIEDLEKKNPQKILRNTIDAFVEPIEDFFELFVKLLTDGPEGAKGCLAVFIPIVFIFMWFNECIDHKLNFIMDILFKIVTFLWAGIVWMFKHLGWILIVLAGIIAVICIFSGARELITDLKARKKYETVDLFEIQNLRSRITKLTQEEDELNNKFDSECQKYNIKSAYQDIYALREIRDDISSYTNLSFASACSRYNARAAKRRAEYRAERDRQEQIEAQRQYYEDQEYQARAQTAALEGLRDAERDKERELREINERLKKQYDLERERRY